MPPKRKRGNSLKNRQEGLPETPRVLPPAMEAYKWKPGQSGNPAGRPRKVSDLIREQWDRKIPGDQMGRTYGEGVVMGLYKAAMLGSVSAAIEIKEAIEGRSPSVIVPQFGTERFRDMTDTQLDQFIAEGVKKLYGVSVPIPEHGTPGGVPAGDGSGGDREAEKDRRG